MTGYLKESSVARFKKFCRVLFSNYFVFALKRVTNGFPKPLGYFLPYEREKKQKFTNVFIQNISELAALKLVML